MLITGIRGRFLRFAIFGFILAAVAVCAFGLSGCAQGQSQDLAREYSQKSQKYYQDSVGLYRHLIS